MLVSFTHNFLFIHCRKAAGTSVDAYLARNLSDNDLMIGSWCAARKTGVAFNKRFRDELKSLRGLKTIAGTIPERVLARRLGICGLLNTSYKNLYSPHFSHDPTFPKAVELKNFLGTDFWDNAFKFTIVRNTYDRTVSDWIWRTKVKNAKHISFHEFLLRLNDENRPDPERIVPKPHKNFDLYTINGKSVVNYIGTISTLLTDMEAICDRIGIKFNPEIFPHAKRASVAVNYQDIYGDAELKLVNEIYGDEIEYHEFKF